MMKVSRACAIVAPILVLGALTGCGQAGPLYLPQVPPKPVPPHAEPASPQAQPATRPVAPGTELHQPE